MQMEIQIGYSSIDYLNSMIKDCDKCPYARTNTTRLCGSGATSAKVMVIGQCPGNTEMSTGIPFSGGSGKAVRTRIKDAGIPSTDIYYTNVIRCKPPANKSILPVSIRQCGVWLDSEINIVKPRLIVCLGSIAASYILDNDDIDMRSLDVKASRYHFTPVVVTYHTAYLARIKKERADDYSSIMDICDMQWRQVGMIYAGM